MLKITSFTQINSNQFGLAVTHCTLRKYTMEGSYSLLDYLRNNYKLRDTYYLRDETN